MDGAQNSKRPAIVGAGHMAEGTLATCNEVFKSGDQEPDPANLQRARIFVDDIRHCRTDGEINVPLSKGIIRDQEIVAKSARSSSARSKAAARTTKLPCLTRLG
jgi:ornithine cyclodeaminase/alanine dehydrogenase-like protein (mu-crystallin family)